MSTAPNSKLDGASAIVGALFAFALVVLLGAGEPGSTKVDALQQRFLVLESTPVRVAANGYHSHQLKVCPHYGKMDQDSLRFRVANETQAITMIVVVPKGHRFNRGDIISFASMHHLRLAPGSRITRRLPSGGQELVP
jgi:hypothetical protein